MNMGYGRLSYSGCGRESEKFAKFFSDTAHVKNAGWGFPKRIFLTLRAVIDSVLVRDHSLFNGWPDF
jgi:hypothetical protein